MYCRGRFIVFDGEPQPQELGPALTEAGEAAITADMRASLPPLCYSPGPCPMMLRKSELDREFWRRFQRADPQRADVVGSGWDRAGRPQVSTPQGSRLVIAHVKGISTSTPAMTILSKTSSLALKRKTPTGWRRSSIPMSSFSTMATPKSGGKMPCVRRGAGCSAGLARCASKPCIKR
jgi:hypothetical protein